MVIEVRWFPIFEGVEVCGGGVWSMRSLRCCMVDAYHCSGDWGVLDVVVLCFR